MTPPNSAPDERMADRLDMLVDGINGKNELSVGLLMCAEAMAEAAIQHRALMQENEMLQMACDFQGGDLFQRDQKIAALTAQLERLKTAAGPFVKAAAGYGHVTIPTPPTSEASGEAEIVRVAERPVPFAYAYKYPHHSGGTVIRFNGGVEVNGSRPIEAIPVYTAEQLTAALRPAAATVDEATVKQRAIRKAVDDDLILLAVDEWQNGLASFHYGPSERERLLTLLRNRAALRALTGGSDALD